MRSASTRLRGRHAPQADGIVETWLGVEDDHSVASFQDFKLTVASDASEDWLGVYEVWVGGEQLVPRRPLSERLALAKTAVRELLSEELVEMYRGESWDGEKTAVPTERARPSAAGVGDLGGPEWTARLPRRDTGWQGSGTHPV